MNPHRTFSALAIGKGFMVYLMKSMWIVICLNDCNFVRE